MDPFETILRNLLLASKDSLHLRGVMRSSSCKGQYPLKKKIQYCNRTNHSGIHSAYLKKEEATSCTFSHF